METSACARARALQGTGAGAVGVRRQKVGRGAKINKPDETTRQPKPLLSALAQWRARRVAGVDIPPETPAALGRRRRRNVAGGGGQVRSRGAGAGAEVGTTGPP